MKAWALPLLTALIWAAPQDSPKQAPSLPKATVEFPGRAEFDSAIQSRDYVQAQSLLVGALEKDPQSPQLLELLGGVLFLRGDYLNCAIALKKAEAHAPLEHGSRFTLAMSYIVLKRLDWARAELEKLAQLDPPNPLYPYWLARLDYDDALYGRAIERLRKVIALDPAFVRAHDNLGLCYEGLGQYPQAIAAFQKAVEINRRQSRPSPWPALNLGALLLQLGQVKEAESVLLESVRYDPQLARARYHLGIALEKQDQLAAAVEQLRKATELDIAYLEPHYALARTFRKMGERRKAESALQEFRRLKELAGRK